MPKSKKELSVNQKWQVWKNATNITDELKKDNLNVEEMKRFAKNILEALEDEKPNFERC